MAFNKQTKMYEGYIYAIFNDIYPEKVYIGQTTETPKKRWYGHRGQIVDHSYTDKLHNAMALYGVEHFGMQVLADYKFSTKEELIKVLNYEEKKIN